MTIPGMFESSILRLLRGIHLSHQILFKRLPCCKKSTQLPAPHGNKINNLYFVNYCLHILKIQFKLNNSKQRTKLKSMAIQALETLKMYTMHYNRMYYNQSRKNQVNDYSQQNFKRTCTIFSNILIYKCTIYLYIILQMSW